MLVFAASMDGQGAIAIQAGKDYAKVTRDGMYHALALLRFGRFDEIRELEQGRSQRNDISASLWDFAKAYSHLRAGERDFADLYLERIREVARTSDARLRFHDASHILGVSSGILEGELHRDAGDINAAIEAFKIAVTLEDELMYDEPEPLPFSARHWLGAVLLEAKRYAEAEEVYKEELEDHPNNGWSLFGLKTALDAQGAPSSDVEVKFKDSWKRADIWLRASRF